MTREDAIQTILSVSSFFGSFSNEKYAIQYFESIKELEPREIVNALIHFKELPHADKMPTPKELKNRIMRKRAEKQKEASHEHALLCSNCYDTGFNFVYYIAKSTATLLYCDCKIGEERYLDDKSTIPRYASLKPFVERQPFPFVAFVPTSKTSESIKIRADEWRKIYKKAVDFWGKEV